MSTPNFEALTGPVDPAAVRAYDDELKKAPKPAMSGFSKFLGYFVIVAGICLVVGMAGVISNAIGQSVSSTNPTLGIVINVITLAIIVGGLVIAVVLLARRIRIHRYRLGTFARDNGMTYQPVVADPPLPGMIFSQGHSRQAKDAVSGVASRFVQFANYEFTTGSGKSRTVHKWGYVAVRLGTPLPHIVLDAVGNNGFFGSNLPVAFDRDQRLSLEGDFDKYFILTCPDGYERDALYLFTPDIMARFIDNAAELDVEIVDDWLFFYAKRQFVTLDPATWAWLFSVTGAMSDKLDQWEQWRDERLVAEPASTALPFATTPELVTPPAGVATPGRRLRRRTPWVFVAFGILALVVWFLPDVISSVVSVINR